MKDQRNSQKSEMVSYVLFLPLLLFWNPLNLGLFPVQMLKWHFFLDLKKLLLEKSKYNSVAGDQGSNIISQRDSNYGKRKLLSEAF